MLGDEAVSKLRGVGQKAGASFVYCAKELKFKRANPKA
jgi:hypothetical protein